MRAFCGEVQGAKHEGERWRGHVTAQAVPAVLAWEGQPTAPLEEWSQQRKVSRGEADPGKAVPPCTLPSVYNSVLTIASELLWLK